MASTDFDIFNFIETYGVAPLRNSAEITGITDLTGGKYRVFTGDTNAFSIDLTYNLDTLSNVVISNTTALNGTYQIENVVQNVSFDLIRVFDSNFTDIASGLDTSLLADPTWENYAPRFEHDTIDKLNKTVEAYINAKVQFPVIMLIEPLARKYTRPVNFGYDLKTPDLTFGILVKRSDSWTRDEFETHAFELGRHLAFNLATNMEFTAQNPDLKYQLNKIESIEITDIFKADILNSRQQFDAILSGVAVKYNDFVIENGGIICPL